MKEYDFQLIKEWIEKNKSSIESVYLGFHEDWLWTSECVFENGDYLKDLDDESLEIAGITGSTWATPVAEIRLVNGDIKTLSCYKGNSNEDRPKWLELGCLSGPCQDSRGEIDGDMKR